MSELNPQKE